MLGYLVVAAGEGGGSPPSGHAMSPSVHSHITFQSSSRPVEKVLIVPTLCIGQLELG